MKLHLITSKNFGSLYSDIGTRKYGAHCGAKVQAGPCLWLPGVSRMQIRRHADVLEAEEGLCVCCQNIWKPIPD